MTLRIDQLEALRPLGRLEQVSACCHHLGFFNNVGVSAHYSPPSSALLDVRRLVFAAAQEVVRRHRTLSAIPVREDTASTYFACLGSVDLGRTITFCKRTHPPGGAGGMEDRELDAVLEEQHNTDFKADYGALSFWRLIVLQDFGAESGFTASFIYHHAIGDGVSGLVFHSAFQDALELAASKDPSGPGLETDIRPDRNASLLPPLEELHPLPLSPGPSRPPATTDFTEWTGHHIRTPCKTCWTSLSFTPETSEAFFQECREKAVTVASAVSSILATALLGILPPTVEALTCIIPVSLRPWLNIPRNVADNAMGTYFDATRVRFTRASSQDIWTGARHASKAIKDDYLAHVSPSGEPYTAVAVFKSIPDISPIFRSLLGKPRDAAFEVTNIGRFPGSKLATEPSRRWQVRRVTLSRSALVSGAAVTVSVATGGDGSMTLGFSWQGDVVEEELVARLTGGVKEYFSQK